MYKHGSTKKTHAISSQNKKNADNPFYSLISNEYIFFEVKIYYKL